MSVHQTSWQTDFADANVRTFSAAVATIPEEHLRAIRNLLYQQLVEGASFHEARRQLQQLIDELAPVAQAPSSLAGLCAPA